MRSASPCAEPGSPPQRSGEAADERAARALAITESLRKRRRDPAATPGPELAEAQASLERRIRAHLARGTVRVTLTDNRYTMISVRRQGRAAGRDRHYDVRLHHMFTDADPVITRSLARYIADNDRDASRVLGTFIDDNTERVRGQARRTPMQVIVTAGQFHDLRAMYDDLNARYFDNKIEAAITWGPRTGRPRRRNSIKMGSYSVEERLIRIHRALDRAFVPAFFVEWIVFHEMLHQVHDIKVKNGRREFHSRAFLADEARFEHYHEARAWERRHLDELLTY
ncbi:MAG: hypothetical protein H6709_20770 [Kofleriaceae bacterium]|nr:hypothetical protein [Kofleriaceae bacterium]MCB9574517.1 hypothetical protein [Kofleriaceae bacterium]